MRYIIADIERVHNAGIGLVGHLQRGSKVIINEKELTTAIGVKGGLEERVEAVNGTLYSNTDIKQIINKGDWK